MRSSLLLLLLPAALVHAQCSNDDPGTALPITFAQTVTGDTTPCTVSATYDGCNTGSRSAFYTFTTTETTSVQASTCGSSYDTTLGIVDSTFTTVSCNDDGACGSQSTVSVIALPAGTYYVVVGGYDGAAFGSYTLTLSVLAPPLPPPSPPPLEPPPQPPLISPSPSPPPPQGNCEDWCNPYTCFGWLATQCGGCDDCLTVLSDQYCASWCNTYVCGLLHCRGCSDCSASAISAGYCSSWCNPYTCGFLHCKACSEC